jgi:hypothetical protein
MGRHVALMGEMTNTYKIWSENLKGRDPSQDIGVYGRKISEWILQK